ncbi:DUF423 domain-containing protein [Marinobacter nanhaiticus D15-8W]|uniref:DUF423 domain-containing protein n=2 Tax=Marinobacter TaxID=2742 RepID=N6X3V4_9GAMM|nr:DUF423 domain-containing protein [Marinobacter nanhaiticus D15-8W]
MAGALAALTGVMAGAFGAHGLRQIVSPRGLEVFQTGVTYQIYHALALLAVAVLAGFGLARRWLIASAVLFVVGILLFSGSLYGLVLMDLTVLGPVTPVGGLCFMAGWVCLIIAAFKRIPESG